jgi:hypothetical protein
MNLDLEIIAGGIFTVDGKDSGVGGLDAVCLGFEEMLL